MESNLNFISKEVEYDKKTLKIGNFNTLKGTIKIGNHVEIGNGCTIEGNITIGDNTILGNNISIVNSVIIGNNNQIFSGTKIGYQAQHKKRHSLENKNITIGNDNIIRENCTIHLPYSSKETIIKNNCFIMVNTNIPHDAIIHNNVTIAYNVAIGGHCEIFEHVNIGLNATLHQSVKIGQFSIIGMNTEIKKNVLPFSMIYNQTKKIIKVNKVGIKRGYKGDIEMKDIELFNEYITKYKKLPNNLDSEFETIIKQFKDPKSIFYS